MSYLDLQTKKGVVYIKKDSIKKLKNVDAVVFDCDGVLIDVSKSYFATIRKTVNYLFSKLLGVKPLRHNSLEELIYIFKKTGGFNNDWDVAQAISLLIFSVMPESATRSIIKVLESQQSNTSQNHLEIFHLIVKNMKKTGRKNGVIIREESVVELAKKFACSSLKSLEQNLTSKFPSNKNLLDTLLSDGSYFFNPRSVGESLFITVFEEIFLGRSLFKEMYGFDCNFYNGLGLINNEKMIINKKIMNQISSLIGNAKFGIASGRPFLASKHTMGDLLKEFRPEARIFLEDVRRAEEKYEKKGKVVNLGKPDPFSLMLCTKGLIPFTLALYVGDSMEDFIMTRRANTFKPRYLFAGVYLHSIMPDKLMMNFLGEGVDVLMPSSGELPFVLSYIQEKDGFA